MSGKIAFRGVAPVSDDVLASHRRYAQGLGLPEIGESGPKRVPLAVVGGDNDLPSHLDELAAWEGDIWAINGTCEWLRERGIDATFFAIDPQIAIAEYARAAKRAVLADTVCPEAFFACEGVVLARIGADAILHSVTAAATAPMIAAAAGYSCVTFFACGGSFPDGGDTHAYKNYDVSRVWVRCGDAEYVTSPEMLMQTEFLAGMARALPSWISVKGNGFLPALVKHGDYEVTHVTRDLDEAWKEAAA